ncbi:MAG: radical SAM protein [Clostridiaceae bacterium]|nr:radical SAM protein [Clostridiaceae bacterium]
MSYALNSLYEIREKERYKISFLVTSVGEACNLKCRDCGALAPYADQKHMRRNIKDIKRDFELLFNAGIEIERLQIQGGEPFLYSELDNLIKWLYSQNKIDKIVVATNGTIIPNTDLLEVLKDCNVEVRVSNYNVSSIKDTSKTTYEICKNFGIDTWYYEFTSGQSKWYDKGGPYMKYDMDKMAAKIRFENCKNNGCLTLADSRLVYCTRAINAIDVLKFQPFDGDELRVTDSADLLEKIKEYIENKHYMKACMYCYGCDENKMIEPAQQLKLGEYNNADR